LIEPGVARNWTGAPITEFTRRWVGGSLVGRRPGQRAATCSGADPDLRAEFRDSAGDLSGLGLCFRTGFSHDRHDLCAGLQGAADSRGLLDALDLLVCALVDLVEILAKAMQKPADLFRHARHGEKLVRRLDVLARCAGAPTAEPVDEVTRLIGRDAAGQAAQILGGVDQLGTL
jgi:hypothetical protein